MSGFELLLRKAMSKRAGLLRSGVSDAVRLFSAEADGEPGVFVDRYGDVAVLILHEGVVMEVLDVEAVGRAIMNVAGVRAVYVKPFPRDRSRVGSEPPGVVTSAEPLVGEAVGEALSISEYGWKLEIRPYDGWSTGLFLDQRENRRWVHEWVGRRLGGGGVSGGGGGGGRSEKGGGRKVRVLNTFAYTCAFSVAAAVAGGGERGGGGSVEVTSVDVSGKYLEWGKRNFGLNGIAVDEVKRNGGGSEGGNGEGQVGGQVGGHRFARMDTFDFLGYAARKQLRYDLIVLDPPSFGSGNKRKGIRPWSAMENYARLVGEAAKLVVPGGGVLCSTNTTGLCGAGRLEREIVKGLGRQPRWLELPEVGVDFRGEKNRFAAVAFSV